MGAGRKRGGGATSSSTPATKPAAVPSWWLALALAAGVGAAIWALLLGWGGAGAPAEGGAALSGSMMPCEGPELEAPTPLMRAAMMGDADTTRQLAQSGRVRCAANRSRSVSDGSCSSSFFASGGTLAGGGSGGL